MFKLIFPLTSLFVCSVGYSQISGTVKDQTGAPIENALVCHSKNPSVWTKTDDDGKFSLPSGNSNTALRVGALRYETIKSQTIGSGTITMATDALIEKEGDVYHTSFDHLRPGNTYTEDEVKDDFLVGSGAGFFDGNNANDRASVDFNESVDPGGASFKVTFPKGVLKTKESGVDARIPLAGTFKTNPFESEDLYLSYWMKFSDNFEFDKCGGKLPSLGGEFPGTKYNTEKDRYDNVRMKGRIMWRKGGSIQFYMELPGEQDPEDDVTKSQDDLYWGKRIVEGDSNCDFQYESHLTTGKWHNIELHYKFESNGNPGFFEGWVDNKKFFQDARVFGLYKPKGSVRINNKINLILLSAFLGGSNLEQYAPNEDTYAWFDEFRVSETRINEYNKYTGTLSNPNFESTNNTNTIYPIPSRDGVFYLKKESSWEVYDLMGKKLISGTGKTIQLEGYSQGMYFVRLDQKEAQRVILE